MSALLNRCDRSFCSPPRGHLAKSGIFLAVTTRGKGAAPGIERVEASDAAKNLTMPRRVSRNKELSAPNIKSAKVEKPQPTETFSKTEQDEGQHYLVRRSCPTHCKVPKTPSASPFNAGGMPILVATTALLLGPREAAQL